MDLFDGMELAPESVVDPAALMVGTGLAPARTVAEILPADFPLPALIQFVPNEALRAAADACATTALAVDVTAPEGLARADAALADLRGGIRAEEAHFAEPTAIAYRLHKGLTSRLAEWLKGQQEAAATVGRRILDETTRRDRAAADEARAAQAAADADAKRVADEAARQAEAAAAPAAVVETLKAQARTATAPPVVARGPAKPANSSIVEGYKMRLAGTPDDAEPNPDVKDLVNDAQRVAIQQVCKAVIDGRLPIGTIAALNWGYLNKRAAAEATTWNIPGLEVVPVKSLKAKPGKRA